MVIRVFNQTIRLTLSTGLIAAGTFLIVTAFAAWNAFYEIIEEEGTNSISAIPFGEFGCVTFLMMLAFSGMLLCFGGIYFLKMKLD